MHTPESDSAVWITLQSSTPRCDAHSRVFWEILCSWLRGVIHTADLDSKLWSTPQSLTPWLDAHRGAWLCGRMHTAELDYVEGCTLRSQVHQISRFFVFVTSFNDVLQKMSELKSFQRECVMRFLTSIFFHDSNPSRPLIYRLKYFQILFQLRRDIQIFKKFRSVHHTAESSSAVCIPPLSQAPPCASHCRVKMHTAESKSKSLRVSGWS